MRSGTVLRGPSGTCPATVSSEGESERAAFVTMASGVMTATRSTFVTSRQPRGAMAAWESETCVGRSLAHDGAGHHR